MTNDTEFTWLALQKNEQRFLYLFDDSVDSRRALRNVIGQQAADPDCELNWHDAGVLCGQLQKFAAESAR